MSIVPPSVLRLLDHLRASTTLEAAQQRLKPKSPEAPPKKSLRAGRTVNAESIRQLWAQIKALSPGAASAQAELADPDTLARAGLYAGNIENMIGTVKLPVGAIGPLRINGLNANGDFLVPLATSEAALIASYHRGAMLITAAGGASVAMVQEGVLRTPGFRLRSLLEAGLFVDWITREVDALKAAAESTTRYGKLIGLEPVIDNDVVFLLCRYTTGDAAGQNMVTIATEALCRHIEAHCPVRPLNWYVEANFSGDKKASYLGVIAGRGRKVSASVLLTAALVERYLHVGIDDLMAYASMANLGSLLSGQLGAQAHYANGLAAFYIATGQDAACVAESSVGFTRMERRGDDLFVSVTLPNVLVGSVGGGTRLPSQSAALELLGLKGAGHGTALAEVAATICLCGELSIMGAIAAGHFTRAHQSLARHR
jgi:hydroxymethylglutaryl-CoA reductase (NADPH)